MLSFDDLEKFENEIVRRIGRKSAHDKYAKELLREIWRLLAEFHRWKRQESDHFRSVPKALAVERVLDAISNLKDEIKNLPDAVVTDLRNYFARHEGKLMDSILKRSLSGYEDFGFKYPLFIRKSLGDPEKPLSVETTFLLNIGRSNEFSGLMRFLARTRVPLKHLAKRYAAQSKRHGETRYSEKKLQARLFEIFDLFYKGDEAPTRLDPISNDYINQKAEFAAYIMDQFGIRHEDLGEVKKGRVYSGRLGAAARVHTKDAMFFVNLECLREALGDRLRARLKKDLRS